MKRLTSCAFVVLLCLSSVFLTGFEQAKHPVKATWVWETDLIRDGGTRLLNFASKQGVNVLYLKLDRMLPNQVYSDFIAGASRRGIDVYALDGKDDWALPQNQGELIALAKWVQAYNQGVSAEQRFKGIHLRIEAYRLPEWTQNASNMTSSWKENLQAFVHEVRARQGTARMELGLDLPYWLQDNRLPGGEATLKWLFESFDHVAILDYRLAIYGKNSIIDEAQYPVKLASDLGRQVLIAINTDPVTTAEDQTFAGSDPQLIDDALWEINDQFSSFRGFSGVAVHDVSSWAEMMGEPLAVHEPPATVPSPSPDPVPTPDPVPAPLPVPDPAPIDRTVPFRGTYIWEDRAVVNQSEEVLSFAKQKNINLIYLHIDIDRPFSAYAPFMKKAAEMGIEVHALAGNGIYVYEEYRPWIERLINYVKDYNRWAEPEARFHGIHYDIEPWVLPEWNTNNDHIIELWVNTMSFFIDEVKRDSNLQVSVDLSVWLDRFMYKREGISVTKWFIQHMDHVTLMDFRNFAAGSGGMADMAKEELAMGNELGTPIILGVETKQNFESSYVSFYSLGSRVLERELARLPELMKNDPSYAGIAVHSYEYWRVLRP
ncbi:hypothetical protein DCC85_09925 [Paenibacillus sp. CAA11]|uniref:hypothetical protein n=1 Tax=Paenibacillus sp. CAA11 TaxID=1532905 RepID=UPI000D365081|nr:hypothetical protein [Paenibacillus sp. CAA11]AWB44512.1 hypothetical protein DCC85_09925 [Paenibacillus sp. CAA11]